MSISLSVSLSPSLSLTLNLFCLLLCKNPRPKRLIMFCLYTFLCVFTSCVYSILLAIHIYTHCMYNSLTCFINWLMLPCFFHSIIIRSWFCLIVCMIRPPKSALLIHNYRLVHPPRFRPTAVHAMVLAARTNHHVSTGAALHHRGARLLPDDLLRARRTTWAHAPDDQDVQQWGE